MSLNEQEEKRLSEKVSQEITRRINQGAGGENWPQMQMGGQQMEQQGLQQGQGQQLQQLVGQIQYSTQQQVPQQFQQLLNQIKQQAQAQQIQTEQQVQQAVQTAMQALSQAMQCIQSNQVYFQMSHLLDQSQQQLQQLYPPTGTTQTQQKAGQQNDQTP